MMERHKSSVKKLTKRLANLIISGCKQYGTYDPAKALTRVEEFMTLEEAGAATAFLTWVHANNKAFGSANIREVWSDFSRSRA